MSDDRNFGVCPDCGDELAVVAATEERPSQRVDQQCPGCDYETMLVLCHYPDGRFVGITDALADDDCMVSGCDASARLRYQPVETGVTECRCAMHVPGYFWAARAAVSDGIA